MSFTSVTAVCAVLTVNLVTGSSFGPEVRPYSNNVESDNYVEVWRQTKLVPVPMNQSVVFLTSARKLPDEDAEEEEMKDGTDRIPDTEAYELIQQPMKQVERAGEEDVTAGDEAQSEDSPPQETNLSTSFKGQKLPRDLSSYQKDIMEDITAGEEQSFIRSVSKSNSSSSKKESRQLPVPLYIVEESFIMPEPRLDIFSIFEQQPAKEKPKPEKEQLPFTNFLSKEKPAKEKPAKELKNRTKPPKKGQQQHMMKGWRPKKKKNKPVTIIRPDPGRIVIRRRVVMRRPVRRRPGYRRRRRPFRNNNGVYLDIYI